MPNRSDEDTPRRPDRDRQPPAADREEARDFESAVSDITTDEEDSYVRDSSSDVEINTHGSER